LEEQRSARQRVVEDGAGRDGTGDGGAGTGTTLLFFVATVSASWSTAPVARGTMGVGGSWTGGALDGGPGGGVWGKKEGRIFFFF
jgi:hypothetical protein